MRTPLFWQKKSLLSVALLPIAALYRLASLLHRRAQVRVVLPIPVICVGNLTAGGAGKTPVAMHIGQRLKEKNIRAFFVSRGYGGSEIGPLLVDVARHHAREVGDEPLLLAALLPTVVAKDRAAGARFALERGAQAIVMDDGFQHVALAKSLSLLVVDGERGFGNGRLLPAGPLREPVAAGFKRADAVIVMQPRADMLALPAGKPVLRARRQEQVPPELRGQKLLAFCGLAYPAKFFGMLKEMGALLEDCVSFPDHYAYREADLERLAARAAQSRSQLVTTAKDAARLTPAWREKIKVIGMTLVFDDEAALDALLEGALSHAQTY